MFPNAYRERLKTKCDKQISNYSLSLSLLIERENVHIMHSSKSGTYCISKLIVEFNNYARSVTGKCHYRYTDISWYVFRYLVVLNITPEIP